jgi:hemoglobin
LIRIKAGRARPTTLARMNQTTIRTTPFQLIGGEAGVRRLVAAFYDAMEQDPALARLRGVHAADLGPMRARLADWLTGWMGGPRVYAERHPGRPCIVSAHAPFPIDARMAQDWMAGMRQAFDKAGVDGELRVMLEPAFEQMCEALRNDCSDGA